MKDNKDLMDLYRLLFNEKEFQVVQVLSQESTFGTALDQLMQEEESEDDQHQL